MNIKLTKINNKYLNIENINKKLIFNNILVPFNLTKYTA